MLIATGDLGAGKTTLTQGIGAGLAVSGPVISEERVEIGRGSSVGATPRPSTVSAREVYLADGVTVSGQIVTTEGGLTAG